jgi:hypothetical protein
VDISGFSCFKAENAKGWLMFHACPPKLNVSRETFSEGGWKLLD